MAIYAFAVLKATLLNVCTAMCARVNFVNPMYGSHGRLMENVNINLKVDRAEAVGSNRVVNDEMVLGYIHIKEQNDFYLKGFLKIIEKCK